MQKDGVLWKASSKAGMDVKTARKYLGSDTLPSQMRKDHNWRTRKDPFEGVWSEIEEMLEDDTGFEVKTLFEQPHQEISWQVAGVRQDAYAKANPINVEQEKS